MTEPKNHLVFWTISDAVFRSSYCTRKIASAWVEDSRERHPEIHFWHRFAPERSYLSAKELSAFGSEEGVA